MSSIEALLQWVDTHPVLSLIALAAIFLSNVVLSICLFLSFRTCTMSIQQCFMYWVERRYPQDKLRQESHPKGWDLESISKILAGLDEIVTLLKAEADKSTEVVSPKVKSRRKRSRRGNKKKAKLSKAQETAEDQKEPDEASLSSIVAVPRKQPKQKAQPILDGSDAEPDNSYGVLTDLEFSENESVGFEENSCG